MANKSIISRQKSPRIRLNRFMQSLIIELKKRGRDRTSETYTSTLNSFSRFRNGKDIFLDEITPAIMTDFELWLQSQGLCPNTTSFYMRILRATYNRAVDRGLIENINPFRKTYTGIKKTTKRALPINIIRQIRQLDLRRQPKLDLARDIFLLSFMLRGMSFIDMAFLKKSQLHDDILTYRRQKTGQSLSIRWTSDMQAILNKHPINQTDRLLPILTHPVRNLRNAYRNKSYEINLNLKKLMPLLGLSSPLTLYVARHSWASAAKSIGIPLSVISEGMGHDSTKTTQIYLASIENSEIDNANDQILNSI